MDSEKIESGFRTLGPIPKNAPLGLRKGACDLADFPSKTEILAPRHGGFQLMVEAPPDTVDSKDKDECVKVRFLRESIH